MYLKFCGWISLAINFFCLTGELVLLFSKQSWMEESFSWEVPVVPITFACE
jgi:hypothetical protein